MNVANKKDPIQYGEDLLKKVHKDARDYIEAWKKCCSLSGTPNQDLSKIQQHPFYKWTNEQAGFRKAKMRLIERKLISSTKGCHTLRDIHAAVLEYILAITIHTIVPSIGYLSNVVFVPTENKRLVEKREEDIILMAQNFESETLRQLFLALFFKHLKNSKRNLYNSGKPHHYQARELLIKRLLQQILLFFYPNKITATLATDIALDISSIFFDPMSRSDAITVAGKIKSTIPKEVKLLECRVSELIF